MNLSRIKYDSETMTPSGFYQLYRAHIINHTSRAGQTIQWNNNQVLAQDEVIGATFEDHILYCVINLIDPRLIEHVAQHYQLKLTPGQRLMDVRADILINIPKFLEELNGQLGAIQLQMSPQSSQVSLAAIQHHSQDKPTSTARATAPPNHTSIAQQSNQTTSSSNHPHMAASTSFSPQLDTTLKTLSPDTASLAAITRGRGWGRGFVQTRRPFCKSCYDADKGKSVYLSHNQTDTRCPIRIQLSSFTEDHLPPEVLESELII